MRSPRTWVLAVLLVWASCPGRASAHLVHSGLGAFYDGVAHLFLTPEDVLAIVAVALLAGLSGKKYGRAVLFSLPVAWLAGAVLGRAGHLAPAPPACAAGLLIASGVLVVVASDRWLSTRLVTAWALAVGLVHGYSNGSTLAGTNAAGLAVGGIAGAAFVTVALVAGQVTRLRAEWARVAVRVAGSWIGAIGLLMLGWATR
jgi:hypothetical protein